MKIIKGILSIFFVFTSMLIIAQKSPEELIIGTWEMDSIGVKISHAQDDSTYIFVDTSVVKMKLEFAKNKVIKSTQLNWKYTDNNIYSTIVGEWKIQKSESLNVLYEVNISYKKKEVKKNYRNKKLVVNTLNKDILVMTMTIYDTTLDLISKHRYFLSKVNNEKN